MSYAHKDVVKQELAGENKQVAEVQENLFEEVKGENDQVTVGRAEETNTVHDQVQAPLHKRTVRKVVRELKKLPAEQVEAIVENVPVADLVTETEAVRSPVAVTSPNNKDSRAMSDREILLLILCILLPFVAVGIVTDWELGPVLLSILLWIFGFVILGIAYAIWKVFF